MNLGALGVAAGWFVVKVLGFLGFAGVTYTGFTGLISLVQSNFAPALAGLPPEVTQMLPYLRIDECMSLIFSGHAFKMARSGTSTLLTGGTHKAIEPAGVTENQA